jgi:hypothetical protein
VIGFNTKLENGVTPLAKHHGVRVETYGIIYELADKVREMMADLLDPDIKEVRTGAAEVRATFPLAKGFVAGCLVTEGKITRNSRARLRRKKEIVFEGKVDTLKRFKDDATRSGRVSSAASSWATSTATRSAIPSRSSRSRRSAPPSNPRRRRRSGFFPGAVGWGVRLSSHLSTPFLPCRTAASASTNSSNASSATTCIGSTGRTP